MIQQTEPAVISYPPAPWQMEGGAWIGLFHADQPMPLPPGVTPLLGARWLVVALIRYLAGTLRYNELIVGTYVRRGAVPGLYIRHIWVDDLASLWGGRHIWSLPKELARFDWHGTTVAISDAAGAITTMRIDPRTAQLPRLPVPVPMLSQQEQQWIFTLARSSARLGRAGMQIHEWSERFPYRIGTAPRLAVAMKPFRMQVPAPSGAV